MVPVMQGLDAFVGTWRVELGYTVLIAAWILLLLVAQQRPADSRKTQIGVSVYFMLVGLVASNGSRPFKDTSSVQSAYNDWTDDGLLEYYWGDHIHLGYYPNGIANGEDFRAAKYEMTKQLFEWGHRVQNRSLPENADLVDMGCGFGGSTRHLYNEYSIHSATGITLSDAQVRRAAELTDTSAPVRFRRIDATQTDFANNSFDIVWSLEMEPHVLDKQRMVVEMMRVLKPGGLLILGCWNVRSTDHTPLTATETELVRFLKEEWAHPNFWSIPSYTRAFTDHFDVARVVHDDWNRYIPHNHVNFFVLNLRKLGACGPGQLCALARKRSNTVVQISKVQDKKVYMIVGEYTYPSWSESIWEGFRRPWKALVAGPRGWYGILREILGIERMRQGFRDGTMQYGVFSVTKRAVLTDQSPY